MAEIVTSLIGGDTLRNRTSVPSPVGQDFNKPVEIVFTFVERFHQNPLVLSVRPDVVYVAREPGVAVGWNASVSQVASISGTGAHRRKHDSAGPKLLR